MNILDIIIHRLTRIVPFECGLIGKREKKIDFHFIKKKT